MTYGYISDWNYIFFESIHASLFKHVFLLNAQVEIKFCPRYLKFVHLHADAKIGFTKNMSEFIMNRSTYIIRREICSWFRIWSRKLISTCSFKRKIVFDKFLLFWISYLIPIRNIPIYNRIADNIFGVWPFLMHFRDTNQYIE